MVMYVREKVKMALACGSYWRKYTCLKQRAAGNASQWHPAAGMMSLARGLGEVEAAMWYFNVWRMLGRRSND